MHAFILISVLLGLLFQSLIVKASWLKFNATVNKIAKMKNLKFHVQGEDIRHEWGFYRRIFLFRTKTACQFSSTE